MVEPILLYGCETSFLTVGRERTIVSHWLFLVRRIVRSRWPVVRQADLSFLKSTREVPQAMPWAGRPKEEEGRSQAIYTVHGG